MSTSRSTRKLRADVPLQREFVDQDDVVDLASAGPIRSFARLVMARTGNDPETMAEAQDRLEELGFAVELVAATAGVFA